MKKFNVTAFAVACGLTWALATFLLALVSLWWGVASPIVELIGSGYAGYEASYAGALIGLAWGFVDAFIGGAVFAYLYNLLAKKFK